MKLLSKRKKEELVVQMLDKKSWAAGKITRWAKRVLTKIRTKKMIQKLNTSGT